MKRTIVLLVATLLATATVGQVKKAPAPQRQGYERVLYGDVESVTYCCYKAEDYFGDVVRGNLQEMYVYKFNQRGDVVECTHFNSDGSLSHKIVYKYDSAGNMVSEGDYGSDGSLYTKIVYKYDSAGNMVELVYCNSDGSLNWKEFCKYDSAGKKREKEVYTYYGSKGGHLEGKYVYKYDSTGKLIKEHYISDTYPEEMFDYKYDAAGNIVEKKQRIGNDSEDSSNWGTYKYDSAGNLIEYAVFTYKYEDFEDFEYPSRYVSLDGKWIYKYDSAGNRIEATWYNPDGVMEEEYDPSIYYASSWIEDVCEAGSQLRKYTYKYDSVGNMIEVVGYESEAMLPLDIQEWKVVYRK